LYSGYDLWRLRLFSFCGYGLALAALALVLFGAYDSYPLIYTQQATIAVVKVSLVTVTTVIVVVTIHVITIEIVTTTILVC